MPRPSKFDEHIILKSAARIVADDGPPAATIAAIAHDMGAPSGSIYHRFKTRDELLGRLWLNEISNFQRGYAAALEATIDAEQAALNGALFVPAWVRKNLRGARIAMMHRQEEFLGGGWPPTMEREAQELGAHLCECLTRMARRLFGKSRSDALRATRFAIVDIPYAAVRSSIASNEPPPPQVDDLITAACLASIKAGREKL